jgi:hypothetical protein
MHIAWNNKGKITVLFFCRMICVQSPPPHLPSTGENVPVIQRVERQREKEGRTRCRCLS